MALTRRIIVYLLLAVFAPVTVLAAMPVVYCVGNDGHKLVLLESSDHHAVSDQEIASNPASGDVDGTGCFDRAISLTAVVSGDAFSRTSFSLPISFRASGAQAPQYDDTSGCSAPRPRQAVVRENGARDRATRAWLTTVVLRH